MDMSTREVLLYQNNKKSVGVTYVFWALLGLLGAHRFYVGDVGRGLTFIMLAMAEVVVGAIAFESANGYGILAAYGLDIIIGLMFAIDAFLIPGCVNRYNNDLLKRMADENGIRSSATKVEPTFS